MEEQWEPIAQQLREEAPPLSTDHLPQAALLLLRQKQRRRTRRLLAASAFGCLAVMVGGYLLAVPAVNRGLAVLNHESIVEHPDGSIRNAAVDYRRAIEIGRTAAGHGIGKEFNVDNTAQVKSVVRTTGTASVATDSEPIVWLLDVGDVNGRRFAPLLIASDGRSEDAVAVSVFDPPEVREVPLWQMPPQMQEAISANWIEAGYRPLLEL